MGAPGTGVRNDESGHTLISKQNPAPPCQASSYALSYPELRALPKSKAEAVEARVLMRSHLNEGKLVPNAECCELGVFALPQSCDRVPRPKGGIAGLPLGKRGKGGKRKKKEEKGGGEKEKERREKRMGRKEAE